MGKKLSLKDVNLSDNFMFAEVMRDEQVCKLFLEELLQKKIERVEFVNKEQDLTDAWDNHGIRLDVFLADENHTRYNIEMQNRPDSIERRSRYYLSAIDRHTLEKGATYDQLPECYIIFVCGYDHLGLGKALYERVAFYKNTGKRYEDGTHVILLNTEYTDAGMVSSSMEWFLRFVRNRHAIAPKRTKFVEEVQKKFEQVRNDSEKEAEFMTFNDYLDQERRHVYKEALEEGCASLQVALNSLKCAMLAAGRMEDFISAVGDREKVSTLLEEFNIPNPYYHQA